LKCDSKEQAVIANFEPESPYVVVCEGFQDLGLICSLLKHLRIYNCDVTYPKKVDGGNGKEAICKVINLLAGRPTVRGILVVADADGRPADSFTTICRGLAPFPVPKKPFVVEKSKDRRSGVFLIPGDGKTGALEHLLLEIVRAENPDLVTCVESYRTCTAGAKAWSDNDDAKMKMQCIVAATCEKNPYCSLAWIWGYATVPVKIDSPILKELSEFLTAFSS
jgi:hypothetical protein